MTKSATICAGQFARPGLSKDGRTMTVHIPITLRHQGGRKQVVTPASATRWVPAATRVDNTIVKALVRAHRWRDILESGRFATIRDLAKAEAINEFISAEPCASPCSRQPSLKPSSKVDSRRPSSLTICSSVSLSNGISNSRR